MKVVDVVELGLGANAALSDIHRLHWNTDSAGDMMYAHECNIRCVAAYYVRFVG